MKTNYMKALVTALPNTAVVQDVLIPEPSAREIRVKVHSVALNPVDSLYTAHQPAGPGRVIGSDVSGTVDKIGEAVKGWNVGDRVTGFLQGATTSTPRPGGFAQYAILEEDLAIRIPGGVSFEDAATYPLCSLTAAQALFIRLGINSPFPSPFRFDNAHKPPTILVYSGATSVGLFAISIAKLLRTPSGDPYRIFATASPKNFQKLKDLGAEAVFDYKSPAWPEDVRKASGGISYAVDCISEDSTVARISETFVNDGNIAVLRKAAWDKEGVRDGVTPLYGAVWSGLGYEIAYNNEILSAMPSWRQFSVDFFKFLSAGATSDSTRFPIPPNPIRLMPGGLEKIVSEGFSLLGAGKVADRPPITKEEMAAKDWMKPISAEKLVYNIEFLS